MPGLHYLRLPGGPRAPTQLFQPLRKPSQANHCLRLQTICRVTANSVQYVSHARGNTLEKIKEDSE